MNNKIIGRVYFKNTRGKWGTPLVGTRKYPIIHLGVGELGLNPEHITFLEGSRAFHPMIISTITFGFSNQTYNLMILDLNTNERLYVAKNIQFVDSIDNIIYFKQIPMKSKP